MKKNKYTLRRKNIANVRLVSLTGQTWYADDTYTSTIDWSGLTDSQVSVGLVVFNVSGGTEDSGYYKWGEPTGNIWNLITGTTSEINSQIYDTQQLPLFLESTTDEYGVMSAFDGGVGVESTQNQINANFIYEIDCNHVTITNTTNLNNIAAVGEINFTINWGDGTTSPIGVEGVCSGVNCHKAYKSYSTEGTKNITISLLSPWTTNALSKEVMVDCDNIVTDTPTPTPTLTPTNTLTPTITTTITQSLTPSATVSNTPRPTYTATPTVTPTITPTTSLEPSATPTPTVTPTILCNFEIDIEIIPITQGTDCDVIYSGGYSPLPQEFIINVGNNSGLSTFAFTGETINDIFEIYYPENVYLTGFTSTSGTTGSYPIYVDGSSDSLKVVVNPVDNGEVETLWSFMVGCIIPLTPTPTPTNSVTPTVTTTLTPTPTLTHTPTNTITPTRTITPTPTVTPNYSCGIPIDGKYSPSEIEYLIYGIVGPGNIVFEYTTYTLTDTLEVFYNDISLGTAVSGNGSVIYNIPDSTYNFVKVKINTSDVESLFQFVVNCVGQTITQTPTTTVTPTPTKTITPSVTTSPGSTQTPTITPTTTTTPTITPTVTPTVTPTNTVTKTPTPTVTITKTQTKTPTPTATVTPTITPTNTVTKTVTPSITPTKTITPSVTTSPGSSQTPTPTKTITPTISLTPSITPTNTKTPTVTPTITLTNSVTPTVTPTTTTTPTITPTNTVTTSITPTNSITPTQTLTNTITPSVTITITPTETITPTITPTNSVTPTITETVTPTITPTNSVTPTITETITPTVTETVTPTITPTESITPTVTPTITVTPSVTTSPGSSQTPTPTTTPTNTITPTITETVTPTITETITPTITPTESVTPTVTPTITPTITETITPTITPTNSVTPTITETVTPTITPTNSVTPTVTITPTITETITPTVTETVTPTITPTITVTPSVTTSPGSSQTPTPTITPTNSVTPTITETVTPTVTETVTPTITPTNSVTPTITATPGLSPSITPTTTPTITVTPSITPTESITPTTTITPTVTPTNTITPTNTVTPTVTPTPDCVFISTITETNEGTTILKITDVTYDCGTSGVTITITGGTPNYQYSTDGGLTYGPSTGSTTYTTSFTGSTFIAKVKDSYGAVDTWTEILCQANLTVVPLYLDNLSEGYVTVSTGATQYTESFTINKNINQNVELSATTLNNTTFVGWSYYNNNKTKQPFKTQKANTHKVVTNETIYALFKNDTLYKLDFCFVSTSLGYELTCAEREVFCQQCKTTVSIYFSKTDYETANGVVENIATWYKNVGLTVVADNGYYKLPKDNVNFNPSLFMISGGTPIVKGNCDDDCSGTRLNCN